tara:strand:- start:480 stop:1904 length:1425 start_codon:yes stop_codon:yes gene_type:complete
MIVKNLSEFLDKNIKIIIIGSGPAGISAALKLEKLKVETLILEAGDIDLKSDQSLYLSGNVEGDNYPDLSSVRLYQFGGSSNLWGGVCNPFKDHDFDEWPIEIKDLNIYSKEAKAILNLKKKFYNKKFSKNLDLYNLVWSDVRFGEKYFQYIKKSKYINLSLNTYFLNFNGSGKKVESLSCSKNEKIYKIKANYFILSCGGIENSRLMLWSREKNKNLISKNLPIGKNYMNHPSYSVGKGLIVQNNYNSYFVKNNLSDKSYLTCENNIYISANKNFIKKHNLVNSGIYLSVKIPDNKNNILKQIRCVAPNYFKKIYEDIKSKKIYEFNMSCLQEQKSETNNSIILSNDYDPLGIPKVKIYWKRSIEEVQSVRFISEELGKVFLENEMGRLALNSYIYENNQEYDFTAGNHQLGGTRMGNNEDDSVVDKNLKVHGIQNLFICGSSVFKTAGHCHPTYTIVKLSLRLANHIYNLKI